MNWDVNQRSLEEKQEQCDCEVREKRKHKDRPEQAAECRPFATCRWRRRCHAHSSAPIHGSSAAIDRAYRSEAAILVIRQSPSQAGLCMYVLPVLDLLDGVVVRG